MTTHPLAEGSLCDALQTVYTYGGPMNQMVYVVDPITGKGAWTKLTGLQPGWYVLGHDAAHGPFKERPEHLWVGERVAQVH
jgi:hypothetical protein